MNSKPGRSRTMYLLLRAKRNIVLASRKRSAALTHHLKLSRYRNLNVAPARSRSYSKQDEKRFIRAIKRLNGPRRARTLIALYEELQKWFTTVLRFHGLFNARLARFRLCGETIIYIHRDGLLQFNVHKLIKYTKLKDKRFRFVRPLLRMVCLQEGIKPSYKLLFKKGHNRLIKLFQRLSAK